MSIQQFRICVRHPILLIDLLFFTILQLCTGVGPHVGAPILQQQVPLVSADQIVLCHSPQFVRDVHQARRTIQWMEPIFRQWLGIVRSLRCNDLPYHSAGHRQFNSIQLQNVDIIDSGERSEFCPDEFCLLKYTYLCQHISHFFEFFFHCFVSCALRLRPEA
jgi:hypothetical protein